MSIDGIELARSGRVNCQNYRRLGYDRLSYGVYGRTLERELDQWKARRQRFLALVRAITVLCADQDATLYGASALQVLGVALPERLQDWDNCHILVPTGRFRPQRRGVVTHRTTTMPPIWRRYKNSLPTLHPVDHWLQLRGTDDELVEVADGLMRRKDPLIREEDFRRRLSELGDTPGIKKARRVARLVVPRTDSIYETRLRLLLVRAGLPQPEVNYSIYCNDVAMEYHVDMGYPRQKVAVEYDGADHVGDRKQMFRDAERRRDLQ
ncbi:MAG: hypothetical protein LBE83_10645, partial [Propionibacteriaceae bacterium]|nr:hypothetical protein [Propionibacteriaceae bacterium]